jgi:hypothetical protein
LRSLKLSKNELVVAQEKVLKYEYQFHARILLTFVFKIFVVELMKFQVFKQIQMRILWLVFEEDNALYRYIN